MWIILSLLSALFLGCYDIAKKRSLLRLGVVEVLTMSVCISSLILLPMLVLSRVCPDWLANTLFYVPRVSMHAHVFIFIKSCLVLSSWMCAYIALKHLPLSTVAPMQATRPMWTLMGALFIFGEQLNLHQWLGIGCALGSLFIFSFFQYKKRDIQHTGEGHYYILLAAAILLGSASGLYDKYMMRHYDHNAVQVYYTFYQALLMIGVYLVRLSVKGYRLKVIGYRLSVIGYRRREIPWSVVAISVFLVLSDFVYLLALTYPDSLIAVVATIRRAGTIIPFLYGIIVLREPDPWRKALCTAGILLGLLFLI